MPANNWNSDLHPRGERGQWASSSGGGSSSEGGIASASAPGIADLPAGCRNDTEFPADPGSLKPVKLLGGSTGARLMEDDKGVKFVVKRGASPAHLREEAAADEVYKALGFPSRDFKLYETPKGPVKLARYLDKVTPLGDAMGEPEKREAILADVRRGFAADALLGNWDVVGMSYDNVMVTPGGKAMRIDNGGSLRFRAQGERKTPEQWNEVASEVDTMRGIGRGSRSASTIFAGMSDGDVAEQVKDLVAKREKILAAVPPDLRDTIDARLTGMAKRFGIPSQPSAEMSEMDAGGDPAGHYRTRDLHAEGEWPVPPGAKGRPFKKTYGGVVFNDAGQVLLREPTNHYDGYTWTFAKGGGEPREALADVALREVREETGHSPRIVGHVPGAHASRPGSAAYFYLMRSEGQVGRPDGETASVRWASPEEARRLISLSENEGGRARDLQLLDAAVRLISRQAAFAVTARDARYWQASVVFNGVITDRLSLFQRFDATPGMTEPHALAVLDRLPVSA